MRASVDTAGCQHMLTPVMTNVGVVNAAANRDPDVGLRAVASLRALTEQLERLQVDNARVDGWSWQEIADRLGVTRQTVHRKHARRKT
jgi:DNA-directed RNA polymerase specialized sigma24 family protein